MDKYIKLKDIIDLLDSKIERIDGYINTNKLCSRFYKDALNNRELLLQLKFEILQDNMMTFTKGE